MPANGTPRKYVEGLGMVQNVIATQFGKETTINNDFRIEWTKNSVKHQWDVFGGFRMASYGYSDSFSEGYNTVMTKRPTSAIVSTISAMVVLMTVG